MICPNCNHLFLPKLSINHGLQLLRDARAARPEATCHVRCPRCLFFVDYANRNTIAYEDCHET